ncbi:leucine-rich repeat domain-containing protein [Treponema socranskii]|uniref:leucine-rich repeat domain-containing protein n=1 Tax=Treponema socranskii TaxID=53419 RepID=UPI0028E7AA0F|nr:leucine-rich repeat domain-containing protein [Treponema socranskii]
MKHTIKTFFTLALALALFGMTACKGPSDNNSDGTDEGVRSWTAELTLSSDKLGIKVTVTTDDGTPVTVEGCTVTELKSGIETDLNANGTTVKLTGKITELSCGSNKLTGLNVQGGKIALKNLRCDDNKLAALDMHGCTALTGLSCDGNEQLTSLNVQGCTALTSLSCQNNGLSSLDVQGCTALTSLSCQNNGLSSLDVHGCTALGSLRCDENKLTSLNVQGCTALFWLGCAGSKLEALNVEGCTALSMLSCAKNKLTSLNVQGCTSLGFLDCYGNKLDAAAFTKILNALPVHAGGQCTLYTEQTGVTEGNCKDFTSATAPANLKAAFTKAKTEKKWTMKKYNGSGDSVEI